MEEMNNVVTEEVTEVAAEVVKNYDWKDYTMTGLAGVGAVALLAGAGFGIFKGVKFLSKKIADMKELQTEVTEASSFGQDQELSDEEE